MTDNKHGNRGVCVWKELVTGLDAKWWTQIKPS